MQILADRLQKFWKRMLCTKLKQFLNFRDITKVPSSMCWKQNCLHTMMMSHRRCCCAAKWLPMRKSRNKLLYHHVNIYTFWPLRFLNKRNCHLVGPQNVCHIIFYRFNNILRQIFRPALWNRLYFGNRYWTLISQWTHKTQSGWFPERIHTKWAIK